MTYPALVPPCLAPHRVGRARLRLFLSGGAQPLSIAVERRAGRRWRTIGRFPPQAVTGAPVAIGLRFPRLTAVYRLRWLPAGRRLVP